LVGCKTEQGQGARLVCAGEMCAVAVWAGANDCPLGCIEIFSISHARKVDMISNWRLGEDLIDDGLRTTDRSCMQWMDKAHKPIRFDVLLVVSSFIVAQVQLLLY
jgi:hypothetical protein